MPELEAEYGIQGRNPSGSSFPVRVSIFKPVRSTDTPTAWACSVAVQPLWVEPFEIYGEGSFQALCLGSKHAVQMFATFVEEGGTLEYSGGGVLEAECFGFKSLACVESPK